MIFPTRIGLALLLAICALFPPVARAEGLTDGLPQPSAKVNCEDAPLARAAEAVRAAYLPLEPLVRETVFGISLRDDPRAIAVLERTLGERPPASWGNARSCHDTVCALRATLGGTTDAWEGALWLLVIGSHGPVASLDQAPWNAPSIWKTEELRTIAATLHDLPPMLLSHASNLKVFRRAPDGIALPGNANALSESSDARAGGGSIKLRDSIWKMEPIRRREAIAHEIGHHIDYAEEKTTQHRYPISHGDEWLTIGGWHTTGSRETPSGFHRENVGEQAWTAGSWPSEEFPNAIAEYRYQARLLRDYSPQAFTFAGRYFDRDFLKSERDPELDVVVAQAGGKPALFHACAEMVQHVSEHADGGAGQMAVMRKKPDGSIETATWDRWSFIGRSPCVSMALEAMEKTPSWESFSCARDPDELSVRVTERLQEMAAADFEASRVVLAAVPANSASTCAARGDLTRDCQLGPEAAKIAHAQAERVLGELSPAASHDATAVNTAAEDILAQTQLPQAEAAAMPQSPLLTDGKAMLAVCLATVSSITFKAGENPDRAFRFWVKTPPKEDTRGFDNPIRTAACDRDYAQALAAQGLKLDAADVDRYTRAMKNAAYPLGEQLIETVLEQQAEVDQACAIASGKKATPEQQPCLAKWLAPRLEGLIPEDRKDEIAQHLAAGMQAP